MKKSDTDGLESSVTTGVEDEQNHSSGGGMDRRQFLGTAAVAVGVTGSVGDAETSEPETVEDSLKGTVEWKMSGVWEDHLIPARNALTSSEGQGIKTAKEELREGLQKLEAIEVADAQ